MDQIKSNHSLESAWSFRVGQAGGGGCNIMSSIMSVAGKREGGGGIFPTNFCLSEFVTGKNFLNFRIFGRYGNSMEQMS